MQVFMGCLMSDKTIGQRIDEIFATTEPSPKRMELIEGLMNELVEQYGENSNIVRIVSDDIVTKVSVGD